MGGSCCRRLSRCRCLTPRRGSVSSRRSSNRTGGFRTRSCLRPRKARRARCKVREPVIGPESVSREAHFFPVPHLVLTAEPLAQPPGRVPVNRHVGRADLPQDEVVRPAGSATGSGVAPRLLTAGARHAALSARSHDGRCFGRSPNSGECRCRRHPCPVGSCAQSGSRGRSSTPPATGSSGSSQRSSAASDAPSAPRPPPASPMLARGRAPRGESPGGIAPPGRSQNCTLGQ